MKITVIPTSVNAQTYSYCSVCHNTDIKSDWTYCPYCGNILDEE